MPIPRWRQQQIADKDAAREAHAAARVETLVGEVENVPELIACALCLRSFESAETRMRPTVAGESICPACVDTPRGRQALETVDQRDGRLFGARARKGRHGR